MTAGKFISAQPSAMRFVLADTPARAWWALAMAVLTVILLAKGWTRLGVSLGDADDAARLLQVREFLDGAPWFDTWTPRMGGDAGMLSHWSRLIDLPIAALLAGFEIFSTPATAETLVRALWPLLVLAPLVWVVISSTFAVSGAQAAAAATLLLALCPLGQYQFAVGRIDHHNVMIAATVAAALLIFSRPEQSSAWRVAGLLCALALAIGYEALAPVAVIVATVSLWGLTAPKTAPHARDFTASFVVGFTLLLAVTTAPSRWMAIHCDAISLNMALLAAAGGGGLIAVLERGASWSFASRIAVLAIGGLIGVTLFGAIEPKCLAGPMGQLPAELKTVWLSVVAEARSIVVDLLRGNLEQSLGLMIFFAAGVATAALRARASKSPQDLFLLAIVAAFAALACWQYKFVAYATFVSIVPIALAIAKLERVGDLSAATIRLCAAVALSQSVLLAMSGRIDAAIGAQGAITPTLRSKADACMETASIRELAEIKPGLIAAHIDLGSYIAALTNHNVLAAPYHRIPDAILTNHRIFESRDDAEAQALLAREHITYVVICEGLDAPYATSTERRGTLRARLATGQAPAFLAPVPLANPASMFKVWRVAGPPLNLQP